MKRKTQRLESGLLALASKRADCRRDLSARDPTRVVGYDGGTASLYHWLASRILANSSRLKFSLFSRPNHLGY